jgi:hypothetical protein
LWILESSILQKATWRKEKVMSPKASFILYLMLCFGVVSAEGLNYTFTDGKLTGTETIAATGYAQVQFQNNSDQPYDIAIDRLKEGKTPDDLEVATRAVAEAFTTHPEKIPEATKTYYETSETIGGVSAAPNASATVGVLLEPGIYVISPTCGGCPPSNEGSLVLTVSEGASAAAPTPDLTVELTEFHFRGLPEELSSGKHLWEMNNTGEQGHYLGLFKLAEGKTQDDFLAWMATMGPEGPSGPPPGEMAGGSFFITGGQRYFYSVELTPGVYVAYCPVADFSGTPHDVLGMRQTLIVK